jgi:hypothetical protein
MGMQRSPRPITILILLLTIPLIRCGAESSHPDGSGSVRDSRHPLLDLTARAGDPCVTGKCGPKLTCRANVCLATCTGGCGEVAPECPDGWACSNDSDFSGACTPPDRKMGERCDDNPNCEAKSLCVTLYDSTRKCLALCKYGCPTKTECWGTESGCEICVEIK